MVEKGRQLLQLVHCSQLERDFTEFAEKWVEVNAGITDEIRRLALALYEAQCHLRFTKFI